MMRRMFPLAGVLLIGLLAGCAEGQKANPLPSAVPESAPAVKDQPLAHPLPQRD